MNWLQKLKFPKQDFKTVGSALLQKLKPPTESFKTVGSTFLQKLKPPVEDYRTVRRGGSSLLAKLKTSPVSYVSKRIKPIEQSFKKGLDRGWLMTGSVLERVGSVGAKKVGWDEMSEKLNRLADQDKELARFGVNVVDKRKFREKVKDPLWIAEGLGQNIPNMFVGMGAALPAAVAGGGALAIGGTAFLATMTLEGGFAYEDALDFGVDKKKAEKVAGMVGIINGFLETLPITKLLTRSSVGKKVKRSLIREITKRTIQQSGLEAGTESMQEIVSNAVATTYDKNRSLLEGVSEAAFFGGIMGGGMSLGMDVGGRIKPGFTIEDVSQSDKFLETMRRPKPISKISKELEPLYHGTSADIIGGKLSFGKGKIRKGGQSGGLFLTDTKQSAQAFGKKLYQTSSKIKEEVIDLTTPKGIQQIKNQIGKTYKNWDNEIVKFTKENFNSIFPKGKADFASISQQAEFFEDIIPKLGKRGIAFEEYAGGKIGKTYQILEGDIPITQATQAVKEVKPAVRKIEQKLLTTPDIAGKGFIMKGLPKRYGLLPATRMQRELETARRMRIEKKVTDPLLKRLDKTNTRKEQIRIVRDYFGLTDAEIKSISRKDVGLMSDFEFKNFIDDVRIRADKLGKKRQAMNELLQQIKDKEIDVENMRKAMKLPTMKNMAITDIQKLDEAIKPFQKGDEFLSVRKLEVVDRTELKGIKTWREAREKLAKKLGKSVEELQNIKVSEFDRYRYDTALAEKNPFYKMMVEESAGKMLVSEAEYLKLEKEVFTLAKKLKPKGITGRIIPQQKNIRAFMEAKPEDRAKIILTETEEKLVKLMTKEFEDVRSYLIQMEAMKMGKENYFTHIRRGILEAVREDGIVKAVKEVFTQYKLEEQAFDILDTQTGEILAMDKFFRFAMHRTGGIKPTENTVKAFLTYMRTFKKKQALDEIVPLIDIYAHSLTPKGLTKKGLLLHGNLQRFVKEFLNTKKGRLIDYGAKQNGKIDGALRTIKMFTSLRDLGLNIPVSVASEVGEQVTTYQLLGKWKFGLGKVRQNTKQGKVIIEKYRNLIGKNPWRELIEPSKEAGDRLMEGIFILFRDASTRANKTFLLGSLNKQEFKTGIITPERLSALRTELGRYRMVQGMKSVVGATPVGGAYTQYKTWAIPILRTNIKNLEILGKKIIRQSKGSNEWKKSILELYREAEITAFAMLAFSLVRDEDDDSFVGQIINKMYRESTTLIQALQPKMFLTAGRTASFVTELGENLTSILLWEKYKTKEGLKGVEGLKRQLMPVVVRQITKTKEKKTPYDKAISEDKEKDREARERIKPIYDEIQRLKSEGKKDEAKEIGDKLSDEEYEIYKKIKSSEKTKETNRLKEEFYPKFLKIQELKKTNYEEGLRIINSLSEEEYRIYKLLKAQLD